MCSTASVQQVLPTGNAVALPAPRPANRDKSSTLKSFVSGSITGTVTCVLFQPLDLVKTNLQLQSSLVQATCTANKQVIMRNCISSTVSNIVRHESYRGLWRGLTPSLYRTVPGIGMYFCTLHSMKSSIASPTLFQNMAIGFTARSMVCTLMLPITVVKTRYESGCFGYKSVHDALFNIWRNEGVKGLFSGCMATVARDAPYSGLYYMFYSQQKSMLASAYGRNLSAGENFRCGLAAGILSCIVTQPADVVKTQLQLYPSRYRGAMHCIIAICRGDAGMMGLTRGILPRVLRKSLLSALSWTLFEEMMKLSVLFNKL